MYRLSLLFNESFHNEEFYEKLDILQECHDAIDEGVTDIRVVNTAMSYTYTMVMEFLENARSLLLKVCSMALSALNNFILNDAKRADKYREFLKHQLSSRKEPYRYEYYEYPKMDKDFPSIVKSTGIDAKIKTIQKIAEEDSWTASQLSISVDEMISDFGMKVIQDGVDPYQIKDSVASCVQKQVRGNKIVKALTPDSIDEYIKEITEYKTHLNQLKRMKKMITDEYTQLKQSYKKAFDIPPDVKSKQNEMDRFYDPIHYDFMKRERQRFSDMNIQMIRMMNGFITIYQTAYGTMISILRERVELNRSILNGFVLNINASSSLNKKNPDKNKKPFEYGPNLKR